MAAPWMAASWMDSYFFVGCSLVDCFLKKMVILLTLNKSKKLIILLTLNESIGYFADFEQVKN